MTKNLVIVESPSKSKTIEKYLGSDYKVVSSKGHIRDLSTTGKFGLGVDVDGNFEPNYIAISGKKKVISDLKKDVKNSEKIYLATDPDREGEAISWHLKDELGIKDKDYERVLFHEITKDKVIEAFNNTRKIAIKSNYEDITFKYIPCNAIYAGEMQPNTYFKESELYVLQPSELIEMEVI
jgi:DNA topoisomerase-1